MKLRELIENLKNAPTNTFDYIDSEPLFEAVGIPCYANVNLSEHGFKEVDFAPWLCTDTTVGGSILFLEDEAVAYAWQSARKSEKEYEWIGKESFDKVHLVLTSLAELKKSYESLTYIDLDGEIGQTYFVRYSSQLMSDKVIIENTGETVAVTDRRVDKSYISTKVKVRHDDGKEEIVDLSEVKVPFKNY